MDKAQLLELKSTELVDIIYKLMEERENLIKYIEDKINYLDGLINDKKVKPYGEEIHLYESGKSIYQDLLERIKSNNYE